MNRYLIAGVCTLFLSACEAPRSGCGLIGCVTSGYLKARLGPEYVGRPVAEAISRAGAPAGHTVAGGDDFYTWERTQSDRGLGQLSCRETITARDGWIVNYSRAGNC